MPKMPKIGNLHIFAISPEKHGGGGKIDFFLPTNEHESFLQVDNIT